MTRSRCIFCGRWPRMITADVHAMELHRVSTVILRRRRGIFCCRLAPYSFVNLTRHLIQNAVALVLAVPTVVCAQGIATNLVTDALVIPRGDMRIRQLVAWTRYDELFGVPSVSSTTPLASTFATDSLGTREIPTLAPTETAIRALSGLGAFRLTAGKIVATANSRVVTSPLVAEYGVTDRLMIGLVVPLVQTRTTFVLSLNNQLGFANVGPNPGFFNAAALATNATLVTQIRASATSLQGRLTTCRADPTKAECQPIIGHEAAAEALIQTSTTFATGVEGLYGTGGEHPGQVFVPLTGTAPEKAISARIAQFDTLYKSFLGSGSITNTLAAAEGPAALRQLQTIVSSDVLGIGRDTLSTTNRISIGDISIGAAYQLLNSFGDTARARHMRVVVNGAVRFGTGEPAATNKLYDIGTGYGQMGVEAGAAADVRLGRRFLLTGVGSYTLQLGSVDVARVANPTNSPYPLTWQGSGTYSAGNVLSVLAIPRFRVAPAFSLNGLYELRRVGADRYVTTTAASVDSSGVPAFPDDTRGASAATEHQLGFGFSYSTVLESDRAPGRLPFEMTFNHVETLRATGGPIAKTFRDQVELRVYLPLRRWRTGSQ